METDTVTNCTPDESLRTAMVDRLRGYQLVCTAPVEAAMRGVPRHVFVPGSPLEEAYAGGSIVTHRDAEGVAISSASAPGAVTGMLEQLEVRPGHRVLEIGAGTGYNATLLACLAGPAGEVTTVDIDQDVSCGARQGRNRRLRTGDGHLRRWRIRLPGPYDRIIVTAGAWDLPPAWQDQLAPGGRLVVPLRIRGLTRSIAFERAGGCWRSRSIEQLGFVPIRGAGGMIERNLRLSGHSDFTLRIDDGQPADARAFDDALSYAAALAWTGVTIPAGGLSHLDFWLATIAGFGRLLVDSPDSR
jgi:protein-L-isoaspartate(D-aspartate) O-methyltransferase